MNAVLHNEHQIDRSLAYLRYNAGVLPWDRTKAWDMAQAFDFIITQGALTDAVLDIGVYHSRILYALYKHGFRRLYGCDLVPAEHRQIIKTYLRQMRPDHLVQWAFGRGPIRIRRVDVHATGYADNHFDFITALSVIEHGVRTEEFLREMSRIISKGGYLIISADFWKEPVDTTGIQAYGLPWRIFTPGDIQAMLIQAEASGFTPLVPLEYGCADPVIKWQEKRYTFIFFVLRKR